MPLQQKSIGITGGIGSGKSTVAMAIESFGYPVFYSDAVSKQLLVNEANMLSLRRLFGDVIFTENKLDKKALASVVFNDNEKLNALNNLMHPQVRQAFNTWRKLQISHLVFNEAAILFETSAHKNFDANILVIADENVRINRVCERDGISEVEVRQRMAKQWSDEKKEALASHVIKNNGEALLPQIAKTLERLKL